MKVFVITLCLVVLSCCLIDSIGAAPERQKRSVGREQCPDNSTYEQCLAYAEQKSKTFNYCHRFIPGLQWIEWQTCGSIACGENTILIAQDLSKSYPDCCERCQVIDSSQPATISGVA